MREVFQKLKESLFCGKDIVLVTIVASTGSTPRGKGARMVVTAQGRLSGTIGGGTVEHFSETRALQVLHTKHSCTEHFILRQNDVQDLGMICGGDVDVHFKYLSAEKKEHLCLAEQIETLYSEKTQFWLVQELEGDGTLSLYTEPPAEVNQGVMYCEKMLQSGRVYIFGGGHVSQALVPVLAAVDFRCVVLEDREDFTKPELFPLAEQILLIENSHISDYVKIGQEDYVCIMTRGHKDDLTVQAQMLKTPACYIGVIGSRQKKAGVFEKLREQGVTEEELDRVTTPIGLCIKAQTPAEIAVSIAAQLIQVRADRK